MDKRLIGMIAAAVAAMALLAYFSRDILFEMRKFRRPYEEAKESEKAEPTPDLTPELLQKKAENFAARGEWGSAKKYYKMSLDLKDSELAKKGLRAMDMLIQAGSFEKQERLEDALEVHKTALPMVGDNAEVKIQEEIRKIEERIVFDDLLAKAQSLATQADYARAHKVLKDAEKVAKEKGQISALQTVRGRIIFGELLAKAQSLEAAGDYDHALEVLKGAEKVSKDSNLIRALREMRKRIAKKKQELAKVCRTCNGEGRIKCAACNGTGWIKLLCPKCGGKGYIKCNRCNGRGRLRCTRCRGQWYTICPRCKGKGGYRREPFPWVDCESCENGKIYCRYCQNGWVDCRYCKGGKRTCPECRGRPRRKEKCGKCEGPGYITCPKCQGTGR